MYIDNISQYTIDAPEPGKTLQFTTQITAGYGSHHMVVVGYESTGAALTNSLDFTIPSPPACTAPTGGVSLTICSPSSTATLTSPINVLAGAYTRVGYIASMRIYIDNVSVALFPNPNKSQAFSINTYQQIDTGAGKHNLVVVGYPSGGGSVSSSEIITVQ